MSRHAPNRESGARCPCGRGPFAQCCGPLLAGERHAGSAEDLMRSRYTAFARGDARYLIDSWHPETRPATLDLPNPPAERWIGLEVRSTRSLDDGHAEVEFVARYRVGGRAYRLHETSRFARLAGRWYYVDGDIHPA